MEIIRFGNTSFNNYILKLHDGYLVLDTGYKNGYAKFQKQLTERGIPLAEIKYVVLTHPHADHAGFLRALLRDTDAFLIYHPKGKQRMEAGKNNMNVYVSGSTSFLLSKLSTALVDRTQCFPSVKTERYLNPALQPLQEYGIELFEFSGHTDADLAVKAGSDLFVGDLCMQGPLSVKHFPMWLENKYELLKSWEKILAMPEVATLYPAHGKPFPKEELKKCHEYWREKGVLKLFKKKDV